MRHTVYNETDIRDSRALNKTALLSKNAYRKSKHFLMIMYNMHIQRLIQA
jgi:hypothetical protein